MPILVAISNLMLLGKVSFVAVIVMRIAIIKGITIGEYLRIDYWSLFSPSVVIRASWNITQSSWINSVAHSPETLLLYQAYSDNMDIASNPIPFLFGLGPTNDMWVVSDIERDIHQSMYRPHNTLKASYYQIRGMSQSVFSLSIFLSFNTVHIGAPDSIIY